MSDRSLDIAVLAAEAVPYVKAGGLGDVAGALPGELARLGHKVDLFLPLYRDVKRDILPEHPLLEARVPFHGRGDKATFRLYSVTISDRQRVLFIDAPAYFDRDGLYTDPATGKAFPDDGERFLFFTLASLVALGERDRPVDVLHCNDYHSGLAPALLDRNFRHLPSLADTASIFSIHNLAYQGIYDTDLLERAGILSSEAAPGSSFEFWGRFNFMKAGICEADLVSTVSPCYAREITESPEQGYGLEGLLEERSEDLVGILNGIDLHSWSPEIDPLIARTYSDRDVEEGKRANRSALLAEFKLEDEPGWPVIGIVSRLVSQKGFDLFAPIMDQLMSLPFKLVILGSGEKELETLFSEYAKRYSDRLGLFLGFDNRLAHLIEAGSDLFLMPSRYEPCGLNQLYSLRYGTLPLVRATGGLADTVRDLDEDPKTGNGFSFLPYTGEAMLSAIERALKLYEKPARFHSLRRRVMQEDHSWARSAQLYESLFRKAIEGRRESLGPSGTSISARRRSSAAKTDSGS
jgi:starch synthase